MENLSLGALLLFSIVMLAITLTILYLIIKAAIKDGTKDIYLLLRRIGNIKLEELKKQGFTSEEIKEIFQRAEK
jgi:hypothetical protein